MVQTVKVAIWRIILAKQNDRDGTLAIVERGYRCRKMKDGYSPYFLMFGKTARHPKHEHFGETHEKVKLIAGDVNDARKKIALLAT